VRPGSADSVTASATGMWSGEDGASSGRDTSCAVHGGGERGSGKTVVYRSGYWQWWYGKEQVKSEMTGRIPTNLLPKEHRQGRIALASPPREHPTTVAQQSATLSHRTHKISQHRVLLSADTAISPSVSHLSIDIANPMVRKRQPASTTHLARGAHISRPRMQEERQAKVAPRASGVVGRQARSFWLCLQSIGYPYHQSTWDPLRDWSRL